MPMIYDMSEDVAEARRKQTYNAVDGDDFAEDNARKGRSGRRRARGTNAAYLIKFLVRIRGARTPPPRMEEPVMKIPLRTGGQLRGKLTGTTCAPSGTQYAESNTATYSRRGPRIRTRLLQEAAEVESFTGTWNRLSAYALLADRYPGRAHP